MASEVESSPPVSPADRLRLDQFLDPFEEAWRQRGCPLLDDFLARAGAGDAAFRRRLLFEFIKVDLDHRWRRSWQQGPRPENPPGDALPACPRLEDYAARFPELGPATQMPVALVREEYWVRHCWGDCPRWEEYLGRFAAQADAVRAALAAADAELSWEPGGARSPVRPTQPATAPVPPAAAPTLVFAAGLLEALQQAALLKPARLEELQRPGALDRFADAQALARHLVEAGLLTAYQVNHLFRGDLSALRLGHYLLLDPLGAGVTGQVFKARHAGMDRVVALKVIRPELLSSAEAVRRFYLEIQAASRLSHPNVVCAFDAGPSGTTHFLAMEYVAGLDLDRLVKKVGPLPAEQAREYIRQATLGLQHIHEHGLVHRDIKPSNLLVSGGVVSGESCKPGSSSTTPYSPLPTHDSLLTTHQVKILDLGLARWQRQLDGKTMTTLTQEGTVMGTPDYMAPEQAADARAADIRADIYSLGCTFYFLLTGRPPFPGGTFIQKVDQHRWSEPEAIESLRPDLPAGLSAVLRRMMAKAPADRFQQPAEVAAALASAAPFLPGDATLPGHSSIPVAFPAADSPTAVLAMPVPRPPPRRSLSRRWLLGGLTVAGLLLAGIGFIFVRGRPSVLPPGTTAAPTGPPSLLDRLARKGIPEGQRVAGLPAEVVAVLGEQPVPGRHHLHLAGPAWGVAFSADGKRVIAGGEDTGLRLWDTETGRQQALLPSAHVYALRSSPDRRWLAVAGLGNKVRLFDAATGQEQAAFACPRSLARALAFTPDGKTLAAGFDDGSVRVWDVGKREELAAWKHPGPVYGLVASDAVVVSAGEDGVVRQWDRRTRKERAALPSRAGLIRSLALAPDGKLLVLGGNDGKMHLWDLEAAKNLGVLGKREFPMRALAFSPDGELLAVGGDGGPQSLSLWDVEKRRERANLRPTGGHPGVFSVAFSPDGKLLASGGPNGTVRLWEVGTGLERSLRWPVDCLVATPDGRGLVLGSTDRPGRLLDLETGTMKMLEGPGGGTAAIAIAADGSQGVVGGPDGAALWNPLTGRVAVPPLQTGAPVLAVALTADGQQLATGTRDRSDPARPGEIRLWDPRSQRSRLLTPGHQGTVRALAFTQQGQWKGTGKGDAAPLLASGGGDGVVKLWNVSSGKAVDSLRGHEGTIIALAAAPDGRLASAGADGTVRLWNCAKDAGPPAPLRAKKGGFTSVAWAPDGKRLAASDESGVVSLWDAATWGRHDITMPGPVGAVAFSSDGRYLFVGNLSGSVYLLRTSSEQ